MTTTIKSVKAIGLCSKHRFKEEDTLRYKSGRIIPDKDIACIECEVN